MTRRKYRQDPATGKFVEVSLVRRRTPDAPVVIGDLEPFVSPLDGKLIGSRRALRRHNEEHDVVQHREYGENEGQAFLERARIERTERMAGQTPQDREERLKSIIPIVTAHER